jgi:hypothetical protein
LYEKHEINLYEISKDVGEKIKFNVCAIFNSIEVKPNIDFLKSSNGIEEKKIQLYEIGERLLCTIREFKKIDNLKGFNSIERDTKIDSKNNRS